MLKDFFGRFLTEHQFNAVDGTAGGITVLTLFQFLPYVTAALAAVWWGLRIYVMLRDEIFKKDKDANVKLD